MNKPTFIDLSWFREEFGNKLSERYQTQRIALNLVNQFSKDPLFLETGTIRMKDDWGAGMSTLVFSRYVAHHGGRIITVDNNETNMSLCKEVTQEYAKFITYVMENSLHYLSSFNEKIDFLYLDSMDTPIEGDATEAQRHNLNEFLLCEKNLNERAVIMIDDVSFSNGGKAAKTHDYLIENGYLLIVKNQQSVWIK